MIKLNRYNIPIDGFRSLSFILVLFILIQIGLGRGDVYDEAESLHTAYLVGKLGMKPGIDFFQHLQSMLWDLLALFYRFTDLYLGYAAGRFVIIICFLITLVGFRSIQREMDGGLIQSFHSNSFAYVFALFIGLLPMVWVIRPEVIGVPLFIWSYYYWIRPKRKWSSLVSGVFMGLSLYASPRFILGIPILFLDGIDRVGCIKYVIKYKIIKFMAGIVIAFAGYTLITRQSLSYIIFATKFSAALQKVGSGNTVRLPQISIFIIMTLTYYVYLELQLKQYLRFVCGLFFIFITLGFSLYTCWPYPYSQNFIVYWLIISIMISSTQNNIEIDLKFKSIEVGNIIFKWVSILFLFTCMLEEFGDGMALFRTINLRYTLLSVVKPGETVLLQASLNPIICKDASFYGTPLVDGPDRLKIAVDKFHEGRNIRAVDYRKDIFTNMPIWVDSYCVKKYSSNSIPDFDKWFNRYYFQIDSSLYIRKDHVPMAWIMLMNKLDDPIIFKANKGTK